MRMVSTRLPFRYVRAFYFLRGYFYRILILVPIWKPGTVALWKISQGISSSPAVGKPEKYPILLSRLDPGLDVLRLEKPCFYGQGNGEWNLRAYRKGLLRGRMVLEKIYYRDSDALKKLFFVYDEALKILPDKILVPELICVREGDLLVACYFEFFSNKQNIDKNQLMILAKSLGRSSKLLEPESLDDAIVDFTRDSLYSVGVSRLRDMVRSKQKLFADLLFIEEWISSSDMPRTFAHGDLTRKNVFQGPTLIDFDKCGYYPAGYDIGSFLGRFYKFKDLDDVLRFFEKDLCDLAWRTKVSALFFFTVFSALKNSKDEMIQRCSGSLIGQVSSMIRARGQGFDH